MGGIDTDDGQSTPARSVEAAVLVVVLGAAILAAFILTSGSAGVGAASGPAVPELPAEGHAVYEVNLSGVEEGFTVRLNLTPEQVPCRDGFGTERDCLLGEFGSDVRLLGRDVVAFSPDHAEFVFEGAWDPPDRSGQSFAGPYPSWEGYPVPVVADGNASWGLAERMVVVAVTSQARADVGTDRATAFAGHPAHLRGQGAEDGSPLVTVEASLPAARSASATYRYEMVFDGSAAFPTSITVVDLDRPDDRLGEATLVDHSAASTTVDTSAWEPLPFPERREGVDIQPWNEAPPSGNSSLFLPIDHADDVGQRTPGGVQDRAFEDDEYVVEAFYSQALFHTDDPLRPTEIGASWELAYADVDLDGREVEVRRSAFNDTRQAFTESFDEFHDRTPILHDDYVPPRDELPDELVTVGDAVEIGRSAIPVPDHELDIIWLASSIPDQKATVSAGVYIVSCHRAAGIDVIATVSAVNGQLLDRGSLFGQIECHGPP